MYVLRDRHPSHALIWNHVRYSDRRDAQIRLTHLGYDNARRVAVHGDIMLRQFKCCRASVQSRIAERINDGHAQRHCVNPRTANLLAEYGAAITPLRELEAEALSMLRGGPPVAEDIVLSEFLLYHRCEIGVLKPT